MWRYRICGLDVASELELPGAVALAAVAATPEVNVRRGPVPTGLAGASFTGPNWSLAGDRFLLSVPDVARFLITAGRDIMVATEPGTEESDAVIFLLGSALSILLHQRGRTVLHASAVSVAGRAVLFCGPSGAGKSTIAAALNARGYPFVNDDVCCIGLQPGEPPVVLPDGRLLKLWDDALDHLNLAARRGEAVRKQIQKFYVPPGDMESAPLPVAALYALRESRPPHERGIEGVNVVEAAKILRRGAHRPLLVTRMGLNQRYFAAATQLQGAIGVFRLTLPRDFGALPEMLSLIEAHWRDLGLSDKAA